MTRFQHGSLTLLVVRETTNTRPLARMDFGFSWIRWGCFDSDGAHVTRRELLEPHLPIAEGARNVLRELFKGGASRVQEVRGRRPWHHSQHFIDFFADDFFRKIIEQSLVSASPEEITYTALTDGSRDASK